MWTTYSLLNSVCKGKYLQQYPRLQSVLKAFDVKKKAHIFTKEEIGEFVRNDTLSGPYWFVRKASVIIHHSVMSLVLEKIWTRSSLCGS